MSTSLQKQYIKSIELQTVGLTTNTREIRMVAISPEKKDTVG